MHDADGQPFDGSLVVIMAMKIMETALTLFYWYHIFLALGRRSSNEGVLLLLISMSARKTIGSFFDSVAANYCCCFLLLLLLYCLRAPLDASTCTAATTGEHQRYGRILAMVDVATSSEEEGCSERYLE